MKSFKATAIAAVVAGLAMAPATAGAAAQQCSTGDAATAATVLFGAGTEVVRTERVAGLDTALVLQPYIAPGTRQRLVYGGGQWCSAETGLNKAWLASGRAVGDGRAIAAAYARLAAAPYFDGTTVRSHATAAGVHAITTHARTNGVTAAWTIHTDAAGVRSATWRSTGFAVKPFEAEIEGLTALDGASERYSRADGDALTARRGLPTRADLAIAAPAATLTYTTPEGYDLHIVAGDTRQMPDSGTSTGNYQVDKTQLRAIRDMTRENYEEFYAWGFRANWATPRTRPVLLNSPVQIPAAAKSGYVYMNDGTSPYCLACVFVADDFQIHMFQEMQAALTALGFSYPEGRDYDVYSTIIGHEMFHNWQNNYYRPTASGRSVPGSYSEGTARFQEVLHDYSDVSHQPGSLTYGNNANGCNGALSATPDAGLAAGVFTSPSYAACQFWMPWYTSAGPAGFAKLITDGAPAGATIPDGETRSSARKVLEAIKVATGRPYAESAAAFARGYITGEDVTFGSFVEGGLAARDWAKHSERWKPAQLATGGSVTRNLTGGGLMGVEITAGTRPQITGDGTLAVLRDTAEGNSIALPAPGTFVPGPAAGERVYLLAIDEDGSSSAVTLTAAP